MAVEYVHADPLEGFQGGGEVLALLPGLLRDPLGRPGGDVPCQTGPAPDGGGGAGSGALGAPSSALQLQALHGGEAVVLLQDERVGCLS